MPKITDFTTVSYVAFSEHADHRFPKAVQEKINDGWQPFGSVFVVQPNDSGMQPVLGIALVKYQEDSNA